jgi:ribose/xylose/arabinose/galactoside ABC-type transport system permease subunit
MDDLSAFGLFTVTAMLVCYALEQRGTWFILAFAGSCALGSLCGFLQGVWPFRITANCIAPGVIATGRIMATVIPGSIQSNRDRSELVALRRLGTVVDCAKVVEFLATDLSDYVTGAVIPIDGGLVRG